MHLEQSNKSFDKLNVNIIAAVSDVLKIQFKILNVTDAKSLLLRHWLYYEDLQFLSEKYMLSEL